MSALGVCYNGRRKVVNVTPSTPLQNVLEEACLFYNLEVSQCKLRKGKTLVDLSLPFRFSSLQPNSSVDLEVSEKPSSPRDSRPANTRISIKLPGSASAEVFTFPVTHTLHDLLQQLVQEGKLPSTVLESSAGAEIVYLQSAFRGTQLAGTTLGGLGLAGQSARFQLRYRDSDGDAKDASDVQTAQAKTSSNSNNNSTADAVEPMDVVSRDSNAQDSPSALPAAQPASVFNMAVSPAASPSPVPVPGNANGSTSPAELIHTLIQSHFDAVSRPAVLVLAKYMFNIYAAPLEPKFRVLYLDNKLFSERVLPCAGAVAFLAGIGFVMGDVGGRRALRLPIAIAAVEPGRGDIDTSAQESAEKEASLLEPSVRALEAALEELQVPQEERPVAVNRALLVAQRQAQQAQAAALPAFDPYKTYVRRVADVNPDGSVSMTGILGSGSSSSSTTDTKLALLATRRLELEGDLSHVMDEATEVLLPSNSADSADAKAMSTASAESEEKVAGDGRLLAAALMDKIRKPDDAPLTTAALRALKKAQTEMVYSRTLIRVRLPEQLILQRKFHPKHSMSDVYAWVRSCIVEGATFDLYVTPPRKVLLANATTLAELQFVPATLVNLRWTSEPTSGLLPHLLQLATTGPGMQIPTGQSLVGNAIASGSINSSFPELAGAGLDVSGAKVSAEPKAAGRKPSWFKL